jgi:hypothetical protein
MGNRPVPPITKRTGIAKLEFGGSSTTLLAGKPVLEYPAKRERAGWKPAP